MYSLAASQVDQDVEQGTGMSGTRLSRDRRSAFSAQFLAGRIQFSAHLLLLSPDYCPLVFGDRLKKRGWAQQP